MKIFRSRKQFLVFFMPGFLLGIIYVNFIARKYMAEPGIFSDYFSEPVSVSEYRRKGVYLVSSAAAGGAFPRFGGTVFYKSRKSICCPVPRLDGHFSRDSGLCGGAEHGDQGKPSLPRRSVPAVCALHPGVCGAFVVLLYSPAYTLEPPENNLCISRHVSWDYPGNICESHNRQSVLSVL